jgi:TnsA endonuclease N terminal
MAYSGRFHPRNQKKYYGDVSNIWYRSLWERKVMEWFDDNENVVEWSNEELIIPYISPLDNKYHRYFPDFVAKIKGKDGSIKRFVIEIKPEKQTKPPVKPKKVTRSFINEVATWGVNEAKFKAAKEFCADRGWHFEIITERELKIPDGKSNRKSKG